MGNNFQQFIQRVDLESNSIKRCSSDFCLLESERICGGVVFMSILHLN
jgi:hypothetical protein